MHLTGFHKIRYMHIFRKAVENIQVSLKSDRNKRGTLHEDICIYGSIVLNSF
jgi:hypothetical protein